MNNELTIREALALTNRIFIDLRAPLEYQKGTIPGAVNIPLFDDHEREVIGTLYKENRQEARTRGIAFAAPKLPRLFAAIEEFSHTGTPVLFCWRGGMRSKVLYNLLTALGVKTCRLKNGYKAYRRFILDRLDNETLNKPVYVLNGLTGVGKTAVLEVLGQSGYPVIDLEGLAYHRGSMFGHLGIKEQRSQKDFDALLLKRLDELYDSPYIIVEGEGKRIGPVYLPDFFYQAMLEGEHILLTAPLHIRVQRILETYRPKTGEELKAVREVILSLEKYTGRKNVQAFLQLLKEGNTYELVKQLCIKYYDRLYNDSDPAKKNFISTVDSSNPQEAAAKIADFINMQQQAETSVK